ncbi:MAG: DUF4278 domain-containing protein, partial [Moorea sp. SIO2B7]|nr:DUF4278 domain-containing protein [Moorena sp. SIO2B7]
MRFSYRGVSYEREASILEVNQGEIGGKYRGQDWTYRYPRHIPHLQPKIFMQYRGVAYSTRPIPKTEGSCISQSKTTTNLCRLSSRKQSNVVAENAKKIHLDN